VVPNDVDGFGGKGGLRLADGGKVLVVSIAKMNLVEPATLSVDPKRGGQDRVRAIGVERKVRREDDGGGEGTAHGEGVCKKELGAKWE
jgi:hypothetical protein